MHMKEIDRVVFTKVSSKAAEGIRRTYQSTASAISVELNPSTGDRTVVVQLRKPVESTAVA